LVKAVYLAGNSYPHDRHLEDRVIALLASRLGIETIPQSQLIPQEEPHSLDPLEPAVREQTLSELIDTLDEPVILVGRSSGTRIITKFAEQNPDKVVACICFAYPFQAVGHPPEDWRTKHLRTLVTPTLIIQGTRDRYGHSELETRFDLNPHTEVLYVDADHESDYTNEDWERIGSEVEKLIIKAIEQVVENRCVFYISGFDPRGARHYHSLFTAEIAKKNADSSQHNYNNDLGSVQVTKRKTENSYTTAWSTKTTSMQTARQIPFTTHTDFRFLGWDDIARKHWPTSRIMHWLRYVQVSGRFVFSSFFPRAWRIAKPAAIYLLTPNIVILFTLLACLLIIAIGPWSIRAWGVPSWPAALTAVMSGLACWGIWRWAHAFERTRKLDWIMRSHAFTARQAHGEVPEIEERIDAFAQQLIERVKRNSDDEILLVGHSSGPILAISALARAITQYPKLFEHTARIALLTLGQCTPMLSLLPKADRFRQELAVLAQQKDLLWIDLSSNTDQICTPKTNQFEICNIAVPPLGSGITACLISPPFYLLSGVNSQTRDHAEIFDLHFQYLKHFESDAPLPAYSVAHDNYLSISTGAPLLHKRFERHIPIPLPEGFDAAVYLRLNPDVALSGISAEDHYRFHGKRERRAYLISLPKDFDPWTYLELNPDVTQAGGAADLHYFVHGVKENRPYRYE
jgi:pimeloyl-ACP methyl ester carboxylesterase